MQANDSGRTAPITSEVFEELKAKPGVTVKYDDADERQIAVVPEAMYDLYLQDVRLTRTKLRRPWTPGR